MLDDALVLFFISYKQINITDVSILVVLDDALVRILPYSKYTGYSVSILVVLDDALVQ